MLVFDQLNRRGNELRWLAWTMIAGMLILLGGLCYVQVLSSNHYVRSQNTQYYRTVRMPALRGRILDRHGAPLAENRIRYDLSLYLEDRALLSQISLVASNEIAQARRALQTRNETHNTSLWAKLASRFAGKKSSAKKLTPAAILEIRRTARYRVVSNVVAQAGAVLGLPLTLPADRFYRHYERQRALPMTILMNLEPNQIARFMEAGSATPPGLDIERQAMRLYPYGPLAAHLLGYLRRDDAPEEDDNYSYHLPDYEGVSALEFVYDEALRGQAGGKQVLVNSMGYRQSETILTPVEAGKNLTLTIDLRVQREAERALQAVYGTNTRGAVVVMDVRNGDILAMASSPSFDPNGFVQGMTAVDRDRLYDEELTPLLNRAVQGGRSPGSTFKIITGIAALEAGWDPTNIVECTNPYWVGRDKKQDLAPGHHNFREAFKHSSNHYFVQAGLFAGMDRLLGIAQNFHFGERTGLPLHQDQAGVLPTRKWQREHRPGQWLDGDTANLCIGQGELNVTVVQMAVMAAAVANGGTVWWPRVVEKIESPDTLATTPPTVFPASRPRDQLRFSGRTLQLVRDCMLADVEEQGGTGTHARVPGFGVCGKTGTAQVKDERGRLVAHVTWFVSFAPYENPRYAVVVKVEGGSSGGGTCAPVAGKIYSFLQRLETQPAHVALGGTGSFTR